MRESHTSLNASGLSFRLHFDTGTFCFCVSAVRLRLLVTHGIAGSTGICIFWRSEQWRQILQHRQEAQRECSSTGMQLAQGGLAALGLYGRMEKDRNLFFWSLELGLFHNPEWAPHL